MMEDGGLSAGQWAALISSSLCLMLVWRNMRALAMPMSRAVGMALVWVAIFFLLVLAAGQFGR